MHIFFNATYLSNSATLFAKGCYIENGILYAKSFYKCCLKIYFSFIVYREYIAKIGPCLECTCPKELLHMLRETPVEMSSLYIFKAMLHSLERHLHLFVLLCLFIIHVCFG